MKTTKHFTLFKGLFNLLWVCVTWKALYVLSTESSASFDDYGLLMFKPFAIAAGMMNQAPYHNNSIK